jgi:DnaJ-class molecular chaperone
MAKKSKAFDPDYAPYGTHDGPRGTPEHWRGAFADAWEQTTAQEILGDDDPWSVLGLSPGSSKMEVKRAFRLLIKDAHPDKFPESEKAEAEARARRIIAAYSVLGGT